MYNTASTLNSSEITDKENFLKENCNNFQLSDDTKGYIGDYGIGYFIEGEVINNTEKVYSYVQITFNLYNKDGEIIGTAIDNTNNLKGNSIWKFRAVGTLSNDIINTIDRYELVQITGW